jgi:hypothetical protein
MLNQIQSSILFFVFAMAVEWRYMLQTQYGQYHQSIPLDTNDLYRACNRAVSGNTKNDIRGCTSGPPAPL